MPAERLQKLIAAAGIASRRHAEELITQGRVTVNGQVVTELGSKADPQTDHIKVDGKLLHAPERHVYLLLNKPKGYVTTVSDPEGRPTVMELVKNVAARVYPVGRLDYLSEGLLLMTNDGELANHLMKAASHVAKTYLVKVAGQPKEADIEKLRRGIKLSAKQGERTMHAVHTAPAEIRQTREGDNPWYEVTLIEGKNRQIRRMFEEIGHHVEKIRRVRYGALTLDVEPGEFRELTPREVFALRKPGEKQTPKEKERKPRFESKKLESKKLESKKNFPRAQDGTRRTGSPRSAERSGREQKPFNDRPQSSERPRAAGKPFGDRPPRNERRSGPEKAFGDRPGRAARPRDTERPFGDRPPRTERPRSTERPSGERPRFAQRPRDGKEPLGGRPGSFERPRRNERPSNAGRPLKTTRYGGASEPRTGDRPGGKFERRGPGSPRATDEQESSRRPFGSGRPGRASGPRDSGKPFNPGRTSNTDRPFRTGASRPDDEQQGSRKPFGSSRPRKPDGQRDNRRPFNPRGPRKPSGPRRRRD